MQRDYTEEIMKILSNYQNCNHKQAFGNAAMRLSAEELGKLPPAIQARIKKEHLKHLIGEMDEEGQEVLAGILPEVAKSVQSAIHLTRRKAQGMPRAVSNFLSDTKANLEAILQKLQSTQEVLPKATQKAAAISTESDIAPEVAELLTRRGRKYNALNQALSDEDCTAKSVKQILDRNMLRGIPKEHRFELVEKMLNVATKRKDANLTEQLFNYAFIDEYRPRKYSSMSEQVFEINAKNVSKDTDFNSTLRKFFEASIATEYKYGVEKTYSKLIEASEEFDNKVNNAAIDFAVKTENSDIVWTIISDTVANIKEAKFDRDKMAKLLERHLCKEISDENYHTQWNGEPYDKRTVRNLLFYLPNNFRKRIRANVAQHLQNSEIAKSKSKLEHRQEALKHYFSQTKAHSPE